jgi:hypothetical protein
MLDHQSHTSFDRTATPPHPTTWLCEEPVHSGVALVGTLQSQLRGVASWPLPLRSILVWLRAPRGVASRHRPPGYPRERFPACFAPDHLGASMLVLSCVTCVCIPRLQRMVRGLGARQFLTGWLLARGLIAPPLTSGVIFFVAFFGLI